MLAKKGGVVEVVVGDERRPAYDVDSVYAKECAFPLRTILKATEKNPCGQIVVSRQYDVLPAMAGIVNAYPQARIAVCVGDRSDGKAVAWSLRAFYGINAQFQSAGKDNTSSRVFVCRTKESAWAGADIILFPDIKTIRGMAPSAVSAMALCDARRYGFRSSDPDHDDLTQRRVLNAIVGEPIYSDAAERSPVVLLPVAPLGTACSPTLDVLSAKRHFWNDPAVTGFVTTLAKALSVPDFAALDAMGIPLTAADIIPDHFDIFPKVTILVESAEQCECCIGTCQAGRCFAGSTTNLRVKDAATNARGRS